VKEVGKKSSTGLEQNVAGVLCYLGAFITGIIFLIIEKDNHFVKFHAMQSTVLFIAIAIITSIIGWVPFIGWLVASLISLISVILWIILMVKTYANETVKIPVVAEVSDSLLRSIFNE